MNISFAIQGPHLGTSAACTPVLRALPAWFGIEEALVRYSTDIDDLPTFVATDPEKQVIGFLTLKQHGLYSAEVYVMGIRPEVHHRGIGRALVSEAQAWLRKQAVEYLQVKTLGPSNEDPNYTLTRAFYQAMGFRPLEELMQLWDENNPCLILVKRL